MEERFVTEAVHKEFAEKIEAENNRQNHRIENLENEIKQIGELVTSVKVLAVNMDNMVEEQKKQGDRLKAIEEKPAKRWESVVSGIIAGVVGILIGLLSSGIIK